MSKGPVISIVEDVAAVRAATENLVKSLGFDVYTFSSAQEFLQSQHVAETACLISDVQMPVMSGIELVQPKLAIIPAGASPADRRSPERLS